MEQIGSLLLVQQQIRRVTKKGAAMGLEIPEWAVVALLADLYEEQGNLARAAAIRVAYGDQEQVRTGAYGLRALGDLPVVEEEVMLKLLAEVSETAAVRLGLRLEAAGLLGARDPRLLDVVRGENRLGTYWCQVDAGPFWYGDERKEPLQQETLPYRYRIGRYAVTNAEYARFVEAGGYTQQAWWTANGWEWKGNRTQPYWWEDERWNAPTQPVIGVTWYEAAAYCRWLAEEGHRHGWLTQGEDIRLPTSLEWERAARHTDQRRYPWGEDEITGEHANYGQMHQRTAGIGCFPAGRAVCGAQDLIGNVWELTTTPDEQPCLREPRKDFTRSEKIVLRGGSWYPDKSLQTCGVRIWNNSSGLIDYQGFRLIRSPFFPE